MEKENHQEIGEVRQKLSFLEEKLTTVLNHLTWAQRVQMNNQQQKSWEGTYQYQQGQMTGIADPSYGIGMMRGQ